MTIENKIRSENKFRKSLGRKVEEWKDIPVLNTISYKDTEAIYVYPSFTPKELGIVNVLDLFKISARGRRTPQWFVLTKGWGRTATNYLVNTEGYDYCRYIAKLGSLKYKKGTLLTHCVRSFG